MMEKIKITVLKTVLIEDQYLEVFFVMLLKIAEIAECWKWKNRHKLDYFKFSNPCIKQFSKIFHSIQLLLKTSFYSFFIGSCTSRTS